MSLSILDKSKISDIFNNILSIGDKKTIAQQIGLFSTLINLYPNYDELFLQRAQCYLNDKQYLLCISDLNTALQIDALNSKIYLIFANCYDSQKNYNTAIYNFIKF